MKQLSIGKNHHACNWQFANLPFVTRRHANLKGSKVEKDLAALQDQFDKQAIEQLRAEVVRLSKKLEETEQELRWAQDDADFYRMMYELLIENPDCEIGITQQGEVLAVNQKTGD